MKMWAIRAARDPLEDPPTEMAIPLIAAARNTEAESVTSEVSDDSKNDSKNSQAMTYLHEHSHDAMTEAIADLATIGFYYLCRPGESATDPEVHSTPFRLRDVCFSGTSEAPLPDQHHFAHLTFEDQKNAVCGETIGHVLSMDPFACPVRALLRRCHHLRAHDADADTPLDTVYTSQGPRRITSTDITRALQAAARATEAAHEAAADTPLDTHK